MKIAVIGAGLIGQRHAILVNNDPRTELVAVVDPTVEAKAFAINLGADQFNDLDSFFAKNMPVDGAVIATPNATHLDIGLKAIAHNIPCIIEKPLAANSADAYDLYNAAKEQNVPVLVGHHRRYHDASQTFHDLITNAAIGTTLAAQVTWCLCKPDDYFEAGKWRQKQGGGPVWINLIHEIDLLHYFLGDITEVSAMTANKARGAAVEDCAAISLRFASGALATVLINDATPSPWHFEGASGENPNIASTGQDGLRVFGSEGALEFPSLRHWRHENAQEGHWGTEISASKMAEPAPLEGEVALGAQLNHFCDVIEGKARPLVSASEGYKAILVTEAILESAKSGRIIPVDYNRGA